MPDSATTIHHDSLFKWLLQAFMPEFFAHYFPEIPVRQIHTLDKEFLQKLESFRDSLEADLLIALEVQILNQWHSVVVCLEHKSWRTEVAMTVMEYAACAWLTQKKPVWSIAFFTDEGYWRKGVPQQTWLGFSQTGGQMMYTYDIIKVNREKSADLIAKKSLFLSLLALRANRKNVKHEEIVAAVFRDAASLGDLLNNDQKLLIAQMVEAYSKLKPLVIDEIKERQTMRFAANSITEFYEHIGELRTKIKEGQEQLGQYESLLAEGALSKRTYTRLVLPLKEKVTAAEEQLRAIQTPKHSQSA